VLIVATEKLSVIVPIGDVTLGRPVPSSIRVGQLPLGRVSIGRRRGLRQEFKF
jgi:hypothetical protein